MSKVSAPFVEVKFEVHTENRAPTEAERFEADVLRTAIEKMAAIRDTAKQEYDAAAAHVEQLRSTCTHILSVDEAGFLYDNRRCYSCGKDQGLV